MCNYGSYYKVTSHFSDDLDKNSCLKPGKSSNQSVWKTGNYYYVTVLWVQKLSYVALKSVAPDHQKQTNVTDNY